MSMSQRSIAFSTTRRPYDSTSFRSHARPNAQVLEQFDVASKRLAPVVQYHEREERACELVADYASLRGEHKEQRDTLYRYEHTRTGIEHREATAAFDRLTDGMRAAAAAVRPVLEWAGPHLDRASVTDREIEVFSTPVRGTSVSGPERTHGRDKDITY